MSSCTSGSTVGSVETSRTRPRECTCIAVHQRLPTAAWRRPGRAPPGRAPPPADRCARGRCARTPADTANVSGAGDGVVGQTDRQRERGVIRVGRTDTVASDARAQQHGRRVDGSGAHDHHVATHLAAVGEAHPRGAPAVEQHPVDQYVADRCQVRAGSAPDAGRPPRCRPACRRRTVSRGRQSWWVRPRTGPTPSTPLMRLGLAQRYRRAGEPRRDIAPAPAGTAVVALPTVVVVGLAG